MKRFALGVALGSTGSGVTWAISHDPYWTVGVGLVIAVLIWFGEFILDDLL